MKNIPDKIYLQIGVDCDADDWYELCENEVTWHSKKIHHNDIEYRLVSDTTFEKWWSENYKKCRGWKYKKTAQMAFNAGRGD